MCVLAWMTLAEKAGGGTQGWLKGYGEGTGLVAAGGVRGHQKGVKRKAENTVITHPGLFLSGPLAAGGRDQLGFVAPSRVIQWWSGAFSIMDAHSAVLTQKPLRGERNSLPDSLSLSPSQFKKTQSGKKEKE